MKAAPREKPRPLPDKLPKDETVQQCPACGETMPAIAGSRGAICRNCGYKESCC